MLIQCQSCTHKFRLNLERLPARKTFVRCKNCGTPIYIHGEEEEVSAVAGMADAVTVPEHLSESPVIPPWVAGMPLDTAPDSVVVTCPHCESRYRMPAEPLRRPDIKLKCTQCEHVFTPPADLLVRQSHETDVTTPDFAAHSDLEHEAVIPADRVIPEPDDQQMSDLLDDMAPDAGLRRATPTPPVKDTTRRDDPDQDYLDATSLGEEFTPPERGAVADGAKYGLFLKPGELPPTRGESATPEPLAPPPPAPPEPEPSAPLEPMAFDDELPPLDAEPVAAPPPPPRKEATPPPPPPPPRELPPLSPQDLVEPPPLPMVLPEQPRKAPDKTIVADQVGWLTSRNRYLALGAAAAIILVLGGIWTVWLWNSPGSSQPYTVETGRVHQLALQDRLEGRYIQNKPSGKRLFVVEGTVENHFSSGTEISWIRLRGTAYNEPNQTQTLDTTFAFIGNVLTDTQLAAWEPDAIQSFHAYNNGRDNVNFRIPPRDKIPFQLVFTNLKQPVGRTVTQVVSYHRNNLTVYVDPGR